MDEKNKENKEREYDKAFERHRQNAEKVKLEYDAAYERLPDKLSASQLEPFAKILLERDGFVLNTETCMKSIQKKLRMAIADSWNLAWQEHVGENIAKLEMLKEHFKEYEGQNWMVDQLGVNERTLPLRIEFKLKRLHWLRKIVERQKQRNEKLVAETQQRRCIVNHVTEEITILSTVMSSIDTEEIKKELKDQALDMINMM